MKDYKIKDIDKTKDQLINKLAEMWRQIKILKTERKRTEESLQESEAQYRDIFNAATDALLIFDLYGNIEEVNPQACKMSGYSCKELTKLPAFNFVHSDYQYLFKQLKRDILTTGDFNAEAVILHKDGTPINIEVKGSRFNYKGRKHLLAVIRDITGRKQAEEQLRKLSRAVEQSPSIVVIVDTNGNIEYVNPKFSQVTGYLSEDVIGKKVCEFEKLPSEAYRQFGKTFTHGEEWQGEFQNQKKNGELYWEFAATSPIRNSEGVITHFLKVAEDITEHKQLEKEMAHLAQLNLIGEMAAGIGHEIRNPMTTVRGFLQILRDKKGCTQYKENFDLMIEELDRANSIITEYLSLAKNKAIVLNMQNLNSIVEAMFPLIQADAMVYDNNVQVELEDIPDLLLDEKEIRQLLLNLARNGLEAMFSGGNLTIRTFTDGEEAVLSVQDQGTGIKSEFLDKLGTPFFTTKEQGTGLGLAVCYSIANRHNAKIEVETGFTGTTFMVRFKLPVDF